MEENHSSLWRLALVISVLLLAVASYLKVPPFRQFVDEKFPWIKEQLAKHGIEFADGTEVAKKAPEAAESTPIPEAPRNSSAPSGPGKSVDLSKIVSDPTLWPKKVKILTPVVFPAVSNGKEVGKLRVPAGTEVQLLRVAGDKLGLVFSDDGSAAKAGGTWVWPEETDLSERLKNVTQKK